MSKSKSGLFHGTIGEKKNFLLEIQSKYKVHYKKKSLELSEHPRKKGLSAKERKKVKAKILNRTANRKEYRQFVSDKRFAERRKEGVIKFWNMEQMKVLLGQRTTREWSNEQREAIVRGERPKYNGKTIQGHHIFSASRYPHLANRGEFIYPVTFDEHLYGWHGGNFKNSFPGRPISKSKFYNFGGIKNE